MVKEYERFDIIKVAQICGISFHPVQRHPVEFRALCPFCEDRKYHLGLNREKEQFHCFRCKAHGNSVSLYAMLHGLDNWAAYLALKDQSKLIPFPSVDRKQTNETPIRPLMERHDVYFDFLNMLRLQPDHRENLVRRGLSFAYINQFLYKSIPLDDAFRKKIIEKLSAKYDLLGIPGFYRDDTGEWKMYFKRCGGIFIPVCDREGYIQGLQMRLDVQGNEKKFRWFSSKHFPYGTKAQPWIHVIGDVNAKSACLTEGAMKADIASVLSKGLLMVAIPGVNAIRLLPEMLQTLRVTKIYETLDISPNP